MILGWEIGVLAIVIFLAAFGCAIAFAVGKWFNWRHVSEAAARGGIGVLSLAVLASVIGGFIQLLLKGLAC